MNNLKIWEIDDQGEMYWISAETKERALELYLEPIRKGDGTYDTCVEEIEVVQLSGNKVLPVYDCETDEVVKKTANEWAIDGEGFVACDDY